MWKRKKEKEKEKEEEKEGRRSFFVSLEETEGDKKLEKVGKVEKQNAPDRMIFTTQVIVRAEVTRNRSRRTCPAPSTREAMSSEPKRPAAAAPAACAAAALLDALEADTDLIEVLGEFFVTSFVTYKRNEVERFSRFVTDWEFREYAYHL